MSKIAKNYIYNLVYQIIALIVPLITAPYLVRVIGAEGTGIYSYVNSVTSLVTTFVMLGMFTYGNRQIAYVRDDPELLDNTFWRIMTCRVIIAFAGTTIYVITVIVNGRYFNYFALYYTYMLGYFVDCTWLFVGVEDMKWAVLKNMFLKLFAATMIFLFVKDENDVGLYIFIQGGSILFANLLAYSQLRRYVHKPRFVFKGIKSDFYQSLMLFLPGMASTIYLQCDKIMIELISNQSAQVSQYDYAEKLITIPLSFITVLSTVMMPKIANSFANKKHSEVAGLLNKAAQFSLFLACPLTIGIEIVASKLIPWYLGTKFSPSILVMRIISPIIITNTLTGISNGQYFTATNQIRIMLKSQIIACIGNVVINAVLIPKYGLYGAAVATLISSMTCAFIQYYHMCQQIKLPGITKKGLTYMAFALIMGGVVYFTTLSMEATAFTNIVQLFIGICVYFALSIMFKDDIMKSILGMVKTRIRR